MNRRHAFSAIAALVLTGAPAIAADNIDQTRLGAAFAEADGPVAARNYEDVVALVPMQSELEANQQIRIGCELATLLNDAPVKGVRVKWETSTVAYGPSVPGGFVASQITKGQGRSNRSGRIYTEFALNGPIVRDASYFFKFEGKYGGKKLMDDTAVVCAWTDADPESN